MNGGAATEFPELSRVLSGYLHEDFTAEFASPDAALQAFRDDASPAEWRRFQREAKDFVRMAGAASFEDLCGLLHRLGSRWTPASKEALIELMTEVARLKRSTRR